MRIKSSKKFQSFFLNEQQMIVENCGLRKSILVDYNARNVQLKINVGYFKDP